ncbi:protein Hook homolog 3-like [Phymastichus coffea]|uniref:protein Hook homolog 3-like n=1 Tax=Phymastichus coffea TaxID=108790 RepID=UPI00273B5BA1|nr:protein Hook homolog 3-like [Phymastichus coffea]
MTDQDLRSLVTWLNTFELEAPHSTVEEISTGVALAQALTQIAPEWFSTSWYSRIKFNVGTNKHIKISNLKKIVEAVIEYYVECLNQQLIGYVKPDVQKIGEHCDVDELKRLLQLVLGCAVNCQQKQQFIIRIMELEESVQQIIMQNIQHLEGNIKGRLAVNVDFEFLDENDRTQQKLLLDELQAAKEQNDQLSYKCTALDQQLCILQEENSTFHSQNNRLQLRLSELQNVESDAVKTHQKLFEVQKQVEMLKDNIYKLETSRDNYLSKIDILQKDRIELQRKHLEFKKSAEESRILKDEVDALRETADKVLIYESTIESYKKKMEDFSKLKKQVKILEDKNAEFLRNKLDYEEEVKTNSLLKSHLELCKKQLTEAYDNLDKQINKCDNLEFEMKKLETELDSAKRETDRVIIECSTLKETNEELRCNQLITTENIMYVSNEEVVASTDFIPPSVKKKLELLQQENKILKLNQQKKAEDKLPRQTLLDDSEERINELRAQNRKANHKITDLENKLEELQRNQMSESIKEQQKIQIVQDNVDRLQAEYKRLTAHSEECENEVQLQKRQVIVLQEHLLKKERELSVLEERYKRYVDKAKSVLKILDPREQVSSLSLLSLSQLRQKINAEKKQMIESAKRAKVAARDSTFQEKENIAALQNDESTKAVKAQEENMMITAFYNFGFTKYRDIMDEKILANSANSNPSFMTMQRAPTPRKLSTSSTAQFI